jgi:WD40 repeat protein/serine/threonine protein kinase
MTDKPEENIDFNTFEQDTDESKFETEYLSQELEQTSGFEENTDVSHVSSSASISTSGVIVDGQLIQSLGEYDIIEELGKGGMGQVFKARHRTMKREVALKVLAPKLVGSPDAINRFHREAEAAAKLSHQNVVAAFDAREDQGIHYLVTELVNGKDIEELVKKEGPFSVEQAVDYITQAAKGLEYAHSEGVIHRDIKPANLLINDKAKVKILDMGLARIESEEQDLNLTASGAVMGTAPYMPPEQGMNTKNADHSSDIYSLGYTLYFMLKAKMPYRGESVMEILVAHREQPIPEIESIPKSLKRIYKKMTAKKPEDRYQSMSDVITALENLKLSKQSAGKQTETKSRVPMISIGAAVIVVLTLGLFFAGVFSKEDPAPNEPVVQNDPPNDFPASEIIDPVQVSHAGDFALEFGEVGTRVGVESFYFEKSHPVTVEFYANLNHWDESSIQAFINVGPILVTKKQKQWAAHLFLQDGILIRDASVNPQFGELTHVAVVHTADSFRMWIDGIEQKRPLRLSGENERFDFRLSPSTIRGPGLEIVIGGRHDDYQFHGIIDEVRISNVARYTKDFKPEKRFENDEHTLALYHFDEGRGKVLKDSSGNGHHGKIIGAKWVKVGEKTNNADYEIGSFEHERTAAEWVLKNGGNVELLERGTIDSLEMLPEGPLRCKDVRLTDAVVDQVDVEKLAGLPLLRNITLHGSNVHDIQPLVQLPNLESLNLAGCPVDDEGISGIARFSQLRRLILGPNSVITDESMKTIASLRKLKYLEIAGSLLIGDVGLRHLEKLESLELVIAYGTSVTNKGARRLESVHPTAMVFEQSGSKALNSLNMEIVRLARAYSKLDSFIHSLDNEANLAGLYLGNSKPFDLEPLRQTKIRFLALGPANLKNGLSAIASLPLERLYLKGGTGINDTTPLKTLTKLKSIWIDYDEQRDKENLQAIKSLEWINGVKVEEFWKEKPAYEIGSFEHERVAAEWIINQGGRVGVTDNNSSKIVDTIENLPAADFRIIEAYGKDTTFSSLEKLGGLPSLKTIRYINSLISDLEQVVPLPSLETLVLTNSKVTDEELKHLVQLKNLKSFKFSPITDEGLKYLSKHKQLEYLHIQYTDVSEAGITHLAKMPRLAVVFTSDTGIKTKQARQLEQLLPACMVFESHIDFSNNERSPQKDTLSSVIKQYTSNNKQSGFMYSTDEQGDLLGIGFTSTILDTSLTGLNIKHLSLRETLVNDLSFIKGLPLERLDIKDIRAPAGVTLDTSILKAMALKSIWLDYDEERDKDNLQAIKSLEWINGVKAEEFWEQGDIDQSVMTLEGHSSAITSLAFSPDGKRIVSSAEGKVEGEEIIKIWNVSTGQETLSFLNDNLKSTDIRSIAFSPDGTRLVMGGYDKQVRVADATTGESIFKTAGHSIGIHTVAYSPNGNLFASGSADKSIKLWDASNGDLIRSLIGHESVIRSIDFSPNGNLIASGSADKSIKIWDVETGQLTKTIEAAGYKKIVMSVAFSPDGKKIASASDDGMIKIWSAESGKEIKTLKGHTDVTYCVKFDPTGTRLVSASGDKTIKIWDVETGSVIYTLLGHTDRVTSVAFHPDGKKIASGSMDQTVKIWDIIQADVPSEEIDVDQPELSLKAHQQSVTCATFSPDSNRIASSSEGENIVRVWDLTTGLETLALKGHTSEVRGIAFSTDGTRIVTGSYDKTVRVWDAKSGKEIIKIDGHTDWITSVAFSPDGKWILSGSHDKTIKIWDAKTGQPTLTLRGHTGAISSVAFSNDGKKILSGSFDNTVKVWEVDTGKEITTLDGHSDWISSVAFSPDGKWIASGSHDKTIIIWAAEAGLQLRTLKGHEQRVKSVAFSPDSKTIVSGSDDKTFKFWNFTTGKNVKTIKGHEGSVTSVAYSSDGKWIASGSEDKSVKIWSVDLIYTKPILVGSGEVDIRRSQSVKIDGRHWSWVQSVSYSPDGKLIASGSEDDTVKIWDASNGKELYTLKFQTGHIRSVDFAPSSKQIVVASDFATVIWDVLTGKEIRTLEQHKGEWGHAVGFSPDGNTLASGSLDKTIGLWNTTKGEITQTLKGHTDIVTSVDFSSDGNYLASGSSDKTIRIWDLRTGKSIREIKGHTARIESIAFSPDAKLIVSGSGAPEDKIKLWNSETGEEIHSLSGHDDSVLSVSFSPDGTNILSSSKDHSVKIWDVKTGNLITSKNAADHYITSASYSPDGKQIVIGSANQFVSIWDVIKVENPE